MLYDLIFLAVTAPIYLFLTIMFDRYMVVRTLREWFRCACCKCCRCQKNNQIASTDDDLKLEEENELRASLIPIDEEVLAQAGIVEASLADEINTSDVIIDKLSKVYPNGTGEHIEAVIAAAVLNSNSSFRSSLSQSPSMKCPLR